jgi:hypothetical protein
LAASYAMVGRWGWVAAIMLVGLVWLSEPWHEQGWVSTLGLLALTGAAAMGVLLALPTFWLLSGLVAVLVAWDLSYFEQQLNAMEDVRNEGELMRTHLWRLGAVAGLGWILGVVALNIQLRFAFIWALLLAFLAVITLSQAVRHMRRESD